MQFLVLLQNLLDTIYDVVVLLTDVLRVKNTRSRFQWVNRWVEATRGQITSQVRGRIQVREHVGWCRVSVVVRWHVHSLHRGNRVTAGRGNAFLQDTHLVSQVWLVPCRRRHTAQQRRYLHTGLREAENVVNEQQHVLFLDVTEVLGHGQPGQCNTQTDAWWLIHLAADYRGVFQHVGFVRFNQEVVSFTRTL